MGPTNLIELQHERPAGDHGPMVVPADPGSVMEFY